MFTFNNENIFTGYLKQLLADFNLPKYKVYTQADAKYHEEALKHNAIPGQTEIWPEESVNIIESILLPENIQNMELIRYINYIKDNSIKRYITTTDKEGKTYQTWTNTNWHYHYNKKELNQTKNLVIKSNIYDTYTHEYLGDYLRFQRDYNNLDLMSLYNCFSNNICQNLSIKHYKTLGDRTTFTFDTADNNYKIYMVPVKLFKKYTIAIDSAQPVEFCCSFFAKYYLPELSYGQDAGSTVVRKIEDLTYKRVNSMQFSTPIIYDNLWVSNNKKEGKLTALTNDERIICTQHEQDLKLFIKVPLNTNSTITIIEGDYRNYNDSILVFPITNNNSVSKTISNKAVSNFDVTDEFVAPLEKQELKPISKLQLLEANTGISHPFADRLVEYLLDNVITPIDEVYDNIKRVQKVIDETKGKDTNKSGYNSSLTGIWSNEYRHYLYNVIINNNDMSINAKYDLLGYGDKDTEQNYKAIYIERENTKERTPKKIIVGDALSSVDIYPDIYKSNKK